jgi:alkyldihydroxyacetonephosphate synthase
MRRWNGWGDEHTVYPLPATGRKLLEAYLGKLQPQPDADLPDLVKGVPPSRLPEHPLISQDASERVLHARGQSLPDWVARRSGQIGAYPDGVAYPASASEVRQLLDFTRREQFHLIPYGGGTSVLGHINPFAGDTPVLTLDMSRMHLLLDLDKTSQLAVFEAGVQGPQIEAQLNPLGFTLGHFPQSFECSSLGGWIATRSSGQQSYYYGRIEQLFAGGLLETPAGMQELPEFPASAAGPDLRQLVLGCEGRLGVITQATVRVRHLPDIEAFYGVFFPDWESGAQAVRQIAQEHIPVSMLRLSDPLETAMTLSLSGKEQLVRLAERGLRLLGVGDEPCLLVYGVTGSQSTTRSARHQADGILRRFSGLNTGQFIGKQWCKSRFLFPYLRNTLWDIGIALDTLETALPWRGVIQAATEIKGAIQQAQAAAGKQVWVFAHLSHVYRDGASIYVTYVFPQEVDENRRQPGNCAQSRHHQPPARSGPGP